MLVVLTAIGEANVKKGKRPTRATNKKNMAV